jgi:uncharacterized protein (DUF952 family)
MNRNWLYHITTEKELQAALKVGIYAPAAFEREGFIHCSYGHQVAAVANRLFRGMNNLVVLEIDPSLAGSRVVDENLEGGRELFPHLYGRLPLVAVVGVHPFPCNSDGLFEFKP